MRTAVFSLCIIAGVALGSAQTAPLNRQGKDSRTSSFSLGKKKPRKLYDCQQQIQKAIGQYEKRRYGDVKILLEEIKTQCAGSSVIDTVHYYLGMAGIAMKTPLDARIEFEALIRNFTNSAYAEEARFRLGQCSFLESNPYDRDQGKTRDAIRELDEFLDRSPDSRFADSARAYLRLCWDKLAKKEFSIARFYDNLNEYEAAVVYYKSVIAEYPQTQYATDAKLYMVNALAKVNRVSEAQAVLDEILRGEYGPDVMKKAKAMEGKLREKSK